MSVEDDYDGEVTAFYRKHAGQVHGYLINMGTDRGLAEEITDDAFLAARRYWYRVRSLDRPEAYIFKIARNERSKRQKGHKFRATQLCPEPPEPLGHAPGDLGQGVGDRVVLQQALRDLPPSLREVIILRFIEDVSVEITAEIMSISPGAVKRYTFEGRQRLHAMLADFRDTGGERTDR